MNRIMIIAIMLLCLFISSASAQRDDLYVFIGTADGSDFMAYPNGWFEIPVFFMSENNNVDVADMSYPLGMNNCYIDEIDSTACQAHYPLSEWDSWSFGNFNDNWITDSLGCTWDSYSFTGFAELFPPYDSPFLETEPGDPPVHALTYVVHTVDNDELLDQTICDALGRGSDPVSGPPNAGGPE
ncbi:MAG: hypothetical protein GY839_10975 [candidate division Zixibacteria bacterium]|nr:hypothetical protein [candidate division Zixibacteria bacterium]